MTDTIPADILRGIKRAARAEWPNSQQMQKNFTEDEVTACRALMELDFGQALAHRSEILLQAEDIFGTWQERLDFVDAEVGACADLAALVPDDVPSDFVADQKSKAAQEHGRWFSAQLEDVHGAIEGYRYVQRTRAEIEPIRELLVRMEKIIGAECYNANIQN